MKLYEHEALGSIFKKYKIPVPRYVFSAEMNDAVRQFVDKEPGVVIKSMVLVGKRGKAGAVKKHLDALGRKGHLIRRKGARALGTDSTLSSTVSIPVLGRVVAGIPILSEENRSDSIALDPAWIPSGPVFLLRVKGDSMKLAAILDGEYVLVRAQETANDDAIIVAEIDGETTIKRLCRKDGRIVLSPENPDYDDIPINEDSAFRIIGTVAGVFRPSLGGPH